MSTHNVPINLTSANVGRLRPYQRTGVEWLLSRRVAGLADEAGLGKTVEACTALSCLNPRNALIVSPASVIPVWEQHVEEWCPEIKDKITIWSYDFLRRKASKMGRDLGVEVLICDEAHYVKNPTALRTKYIYSTRRQFRGFANYASRLWLLSATPAPNHPGEYWTHLYFAGLTPLPYYDFLMRYCRIDQTPYGPRVTALRKDTLDELRSMVRKVWLRRSVSDVLKELPQWTWSDLRLWLFKAKDIGAYIVNNDRAFEFMKAFENAKTDEEILSILQNEAPHLTTLRRLTGLLKLPAIFEWLDSYLISGKKIVLWCLHHDVINQIHNWLADRDVGNVQLTGMSSSHQRSEAIERFQNDPEVKVFLGQINAAGVGISLTAASTALVVELPWTPADLYQCAKRIHRIGQTQPVQIYVASIAGSIDEAIARVITRKAKMIDLLEGQRC